MTFDDAIAESVATQLINALGPENALDLAGAKYSEFRDDPVGFGETILGESYTDDVRAMMESVRDYEVTIAVSANATGKTHGAARVALWGYMTRRNIEIYTAAAPPEDNLKRLLWGEIAHIQSKHPNLLQNSKVTNLHIERAPKQFIDGVTIPSSGDAKTREAKFSGKHQKNLMFIFDEGDAIPDEVYAGRESCTSGGWFRTLIMFNPRQQKGEVYRMIRDGRANVVYLSAFRHPNVVTGRNIIPGAVDRNTTARRINQMCRPMKDGETKEGFSTFELPEFMEGVEAKDQKGQMLPPLKSGTYKVMVPSFSHLVLGEYPAQAEDQLISLEWINAARSRWDLYVSMYGETIPHGVQGVAGLDPGEFGQDATALIERYGGWVPMPHEWHGVDVIITSDRASNIISGLPIECTNVDANGVGSGVPPDMSRRYGLTAQAVKTQETGPLKDIPESEKELGDFKIVRDYLAWKARNWLKNDPGAMLPPDEELLEELRIPTYSVGRWVRVMDKDTMKELLKRSPNKFDALCLTFYEPLRNINSAQRISQSEHDRLKALHSRYGGGRPPYSITR